MGHTAVVGFCISISCFYLASRFTQKLFLPLLLKFSVFKHALFLPPDLFLWRIKIEDPF